MLEPPLGGQTVTVVERVHAGHGDHVDGARTSWAGCSLQPMSSQEQVRFGLLVTRRWQLFAPPGFAARAQDQCEVVPGPVTAEGAPLRLGFHGAPEVWPDETGEPHHVEGSVRLVEGSS